MRIILQMRVQRRTSGVEIFELAQRRRERLGVVDQIERHRVGGEFAHPRQGEEE